MRDIILRVDGPIIIARLGRNHNVDCNSLTIQIGGSTCEFEILNNVHQMVSFGMSCEKRYAPKCEKMIISYRTYKNFKEADYLNEL